MCCNLVLLSLIYGLGEEGEREREVVWYFDPFYIAFLDNLGLLLLLQETFDRLQGPTDGPTVSFCPA